MIGLNDEFEYGLSGKDKLLLFGPAEKSDLCSRNGLLTSVPCMTLDKERWRRWTQGDWSVPRLPRESHLRDELLSIIDELAEAPRLSDPNHWLSGKDGCVRVRVGEVDQTSWVEDIYTWKKGSRGVPFIRGIHFRMKLKNVRKIYIILLSNISKHFMIDI